MWVEALRVLGVDVDAGTVVTVALAALAWAGGLTKWAFSMSADVKRQGETLDKLGLTSAELHLLGERIGQVELDASRRYVPLEEFRAHEDRVNASLERLHVRLDDIPRQLAEVVNNALRLGPPR